MPKPTLTVDDNILDRSHDARLKAGNLVIGYLGDKTFFGRNTIRLITKQICHNAVEETVNRQYFCPPLQLANQVF